jgi:hypothetical protein
MPDVSNVERLLNDVGTWARSESDVRAIALVGSWARGTAHDNSDVDLVVLTRSPDRLVRETAWTQCVGTPAAVVTEDWGAITSVRVRYSTGEEVEYGIGSVGWASTSSIDHGTRSVISDGVVTLYDPDHLLAELRASIAASRRSRRNRRRLRPGVSESLA